MSSRVRLTERASDIHVTVLGLVDLHSLRFSCLLASYLAASFKKHKQDKRLQNAQAGSALERGLLCI